LGACRGGEGKKKVYSLGSRRSGRLQIGAFMREEWVSAAKWLNRALWLALGCASLIGHAERITVFPQPSYRPALQSTARIVLRASSALCPQTCKKPEASASQGRGGIINREPLSSDASCHLATYVPVAHGPTTAWSDGALTNDCVRWSHYCCTLLLHSIRQHL
jgi:hypothetical protein